MRSKYLINKILQNRVFQHTLFWSISYFVLINLFAYSGHIQKIDCIYTAIFHVPLLIGVYVNIFILIPKFLSKQRYFLYFLFISFIVVFSSEFNIIIFSKLINYILHDYYFIAYYGFFDLLKFTIIYIGISSLLKFSKGWFQLYEANRWVSQLQKEKIESELKALKGQINPHFLFNSMNSIYSLSLNKSEKTPEIILKLSDIMRYIIYEANADFVDLAKEVSYLKNYIDLQKLRSDDRAIIDFDIVGDLKNIHIAPLLFFPLIENSFKHGIKGVTGKSFVNIVLDTTSDKYIKFSIENNKGITDNVEKKEYKGIGLDNVNRRLEMIYPDKHKLSIFDTNDTFKVELIIEQVL